MNTKNTQTPYEHAITPRTQDFSQWYQDVIEAGELAEHAPVKGCMVIRPHGYAIWEHIQRLLDTRLKASGVQNAYFPLFIPESYLLKEQEHVEGFSPELAVVTHAGGEDLEERLVVRPTSETIMYHEFAKWIRSWRDLPLILNQWCNVVRWEKRPRLFVRTSEFLWQEGHTAHATEAEAEQEAVSRLEMYKDFCESELALPVFAGKKTEAEKFAGAQHTYTIEAMMQDGKALQTATSHHLGQNFSRAFEIQFTDKEGAEQYVWQTSWGLSTRIIGALIMTHGDDKGLVLPPRVAPVQVVIVPIYSNDEQKQTILHTAHELKRGLADFRVCVDEREHRTPGAKYNEWEKKGVCIRLELGPKDLEKKQVILARRDHEEKRPVALDTVAIEVENELRDMQQALYVRALTFRDAHTYEVNDWKDFCVFMKEDYGFVSAHFCQDASCEEIIKEETQSTTRCIPFVEMKETGACIRCGKSSQQRLYFAKAY